MFASLKRQQREFDPQVVTIEHLRVKQGYYNLQYNHGPNQFYLHS